MRILWNIGGGICVALGVIGAVVPLMPSVVFMLMAAFCFARGSERVHAWLVTHPRFGPPILDWQRSGAIARPAKRAACGAIALTFAISLALGLPGNVLAIQAVVLTCVVVFILSRPSGPRPGAVAD